MAATYRVRFSAKPHPSEWRRAEAQSLDVEGDLDGIPALLPPDSYILSIEDLAAGRNVHWTRWPEAYRPGSGG
jgi:hypothetical protein